jgi:hypothetical protein
MANTALFCLFFLLVTTSARAQAPVFTTVSVSGNGVFAGVKREAKGEEPETYLLRIKDLDSTRILLPGELLHREVVGLFPAEQGLLIVMTQRTIEQGDEPRLHRFSLQSREWKQIAKVDCTSFAKVRTEKNSITVHCLDSGSDGVEKENPRKVELAGVRLLESRDVTLPLFRSESKGLMAELQGEPFAWTRLRVRTGRRERIFEP